MRAGRDDSEPEGPVEPPEPRCFSCGNRISAGTLAVFGGIEFHRACLDEEIDVPRDGKSFPPDDEADRAA